MKIDQSFVRDMLADQADLAIMQAIIGLGHTLGLRVVAEGVERAAEEKLLRAAGCDELQGHLFASALPVAELVAWLVGKPIADAASPHRKARAPAAALLPLAV